MPSCGRAQGISSAAERIQVKHAQGVLQRLHVPGNHLLHRFRHAVASSHGSAMLDDPALSADEVVLLFPGPEGTVVKVAGSDPTVADLVAGGQFTVGEAVQADLVLPAIGDLMALKMT